MIAAPPQATMAMVVGRCVVPVPSMALADAPGIFVPHLMVSLCQSSHGLPSWLRCALGYDGDPSRKAGATVLFDEIRKALMAKRGKRKANVFVDDAGRVLPSLVPLPIRGQESLASNNL